MTEALTPVKRALIEIRELKARLAAAEAGQRVAEAAQREPIAIVGVGLRFPGGVCDAAGFAELLWSGTDAVGPIPPERFPLDELYAEDPDAPGKLTTRHGAFLDDIDRFDAEFFGIAPREAAIMDPQQRLLLEVGWEALEDAGHAAGLRGTRAGVYLGICNSDYGRALFARRELIDAYVSTGNAASVAAGRLSYVLGIHGPSMAIDTACSSSLVAVHLACQGLRAGECDLALAGGINLILTPEMNISFSKARMMAPDGRCKTFDAAADGYVRGEGCAVLVLRRLTDAVKDHDRILAVLRGSAVNQDGRSGGLTAPNGPAQEAVIRAALDASGVAAADIGYVETHGTGTSLGDPIEVGALAAVLCGEGRAQPLAVGAVKTNIGHLEAAAGVAGVIKAILALQRREIPPNLHFHQGNPHIDWSAPITVPTAVTPFAPIGGRRLAGVSSFGFSGTNAHVILEEAPSLPAAAAAPERPLHLLALSARDETTLAALARRYQTALTSETPVADACFTANAGRAHFACRLAVTGATSDELTRGLAAHLAGEAHPAVAAGRAEGARPQIAFLFTGQGAQYAGMGRRLYETAPVFRRTLDDCAARLAPYLPRGLIDVLFAPEISTPINTTAWAQPATFAVEVALAALWRSFGIEPAVVLGHSLGEYAAACAAGLLPLDDALRLVAARGRLTQELVAEGAMAAIFAPQEVVAAEVARSAGALAIAAYNGPAHHVISGAPALVEAAVTRFEAAGVEVKRLRVPHAAHSPLIEPVLPAFRNVLAGIRFAVPHTALISNVTGAVAGAEEIGRADYWLAHMREPVRFAQSMQVLAAQGITHCIEVGPHPVLIGIGAESLPGSAVEWLPSLRRNRPDWCDLLESLQRLYVGGAGIDWAGFDQNYPRRRVALPTTPFRRSRHWIDAVGAAPAAAPSVAPWPAVTAALDRQALQAPLDLNAASYPAKWEVLARLTSAHAVRTLREAGLFATAGERHTLPGILQAAGIAASYRHLVRRWLDRLVEAGLLHSDGETYVAAAPLPDPGLEAQWEEAENLFADNRPLLAYVRHCGALVGAVLAGRESPLETLFPGGQFDLAEDLYERSATMRYVNALAAAALEALARALPPGRCLRILEVGAGTGGTSAALLPLLPADRSKYLFTDVSDPFLDRARARFAAYSFVGFARLDIDRDPAAQGLVAGFDVIVSANAIHAATDLRAALGRLHDLLAPGGTLILIESTTHLAWFDMTTGLIEGWQHFADDLRREHPLLPPADWVAALGDAGFAEAGAWPRPGTSADHLGQHVLVARRPGDDAIGAVAETPVVVAETRGAPIEIPVAAAADGLRHRLAEALPADRIALMRDFVRARVMAVLRLDPTDPPGRNARLMDLGFDSLMAVQLRNQLGTGLALEKPLPATLMFDHPTIDALAAHLTGRLFPADPGDLAVPAPPSPTPALGAAVVAAMSDAEVEALLLERLAQS